MRDDAQVLGEAFMWVTLTLTQAENMSEASLDGQEDEFRFRNVKGEMPVRCTTGKVQ